jgi:hypothetical protein
LGLFFFTGVKQFSPVAKNAIYRALPVLPVVKSGICRASGFLPVVKHYLFLQQYTVYQYVN